MEFWRIYRLIYSKRWLIAATMLIAALVIFLGTSLQAQKRAYQSVAILQPQDNILPEAIARTTDSGPANAFSASNGPDNTSNISNLIMLLRSSNDFYNKTADLLREDEGLREIDVQRILERNGFFASVDNDIQNQANHMVQKGDMTQDEADKWISTNKQASRTRTVEQLAKGRDASGAFGSAGVKLTSDEIADRIREKVTFDTVQGPLSTDNVPQIADQIQVTGKFEREAEANLYVNLLCVEFLDYYTNERASAVNAQIALLNEKLVEAKRRLRDARAAEVDFRKATGVSLTTAADATVGKAEDLQTKRDEAETDLNSDEAAVRSLQAALSTTLPTRTTALPAEENPEVRNLRLAVDEANMQFQAIQGSNEGAPNNDKYIAAKSRLDAAKSALKEALNRNYTSTAPTVGIDDLKSKLDNAMMQRDEAQQRLSTLSQQLTTQKAQLLNLPAAEAKLADLHREIALTEQNVRDLETTVDRETTYGIEHGRAGTINIVSEAHTIPIVSSIAAQRGKLMIYGMVLALFLGIVLVVAQDGLDNSIRTAEDVEKLTGLPVAGIIPEHLPDPARSPRVALLEPLSPAAEAYRLLRTDLLFTAADKPFRSLVTATAKPGQGATTTICNLAIVLAQSGKRVILVDADLRHAKLHRIFRTQNEFGLTSLLGDNCSLDEALTATEVENLTLLPAGPFVMNPSDGLASPRMVELHEELKQLADYVLFDTPSAVAYSDTAILSSFLDATLMVVHADTVPRGTEHQVRGMLTKARANMIGVVLNAVAPDRVDSVHYNDAYYPALPGVSTNGSGRNGNSIGTTSSARLGSGGSASADDNIIALPLRRSGGDGAAVVPVFASSTSTEIVPEGRSGERVGAEPVTTGRTAAAPHAGTLLDSTAPRSPSEKGRQRLRLKTVIIVLVAGLVLGALVLMLSTGTTVK